MATAGKKGTVLAAVIIASMLSLGSEAATTTQASQQVEQQNKVVVDEQTLDDELDALIEGDDDLFGSEDSSGAGDDAKDSSESIASQLVDNFHLNVSLGYLRLNKAPNYIKIDQDHSPTKLPFKNTQNLFLSSDFGTHIALYDNLKLNFEGIVDLSNLDDALENTRNTGLQIVKMDTRYFFGIKKLFLQYEASKIDFYFGYKMLYLPMDLPGVSVVDTYNSSIFTGFMPAPTGRLQAAMDYHLGGDNQIMLAVFPYPESSNITPQLFMWGDSIDTYSVWTYIIDNIPGGSGGLIGKEIKFHSTDYDARPSQWSYLAKYHGMSRAASWFVSLYYGLSDSSILRINSTSKSLVDATTLAPKVLQLSDGATWKLGKQELHFQSLLNFSKAQEDYSYLTGLIGYRYSLSALAKKLHIKLLNVGVSASGEVILQKAKERSIENLNLIDSSWTDGANHQLGLDMKAALNYNTFLAAMFQYDYDTYSTSYSLGLMHNFKNQWKLTGYYIFIHNLSVKLNMRDGNFSLLKDNGVLGLSLSCNIK